MTLDELLQRLEEYRDLLGGDAEVRLMTQSHWPFENAILGMVSKDEIEAASEDEEDLPEGDSQEAVLYLVEGEQLGYGDKRAWEVVN